MVTLVPALFIAAVLAVTYRMATAPEVEASTVGLIEAGGLVAAPEPEREASTGLIGAPEQESELKEPLAEKAKEAVPPSAAEQKSPAGAAAAKAEPAEKVAVAGEQERLPVPLWVWIPRRGGPRARPGHHPPL